MSNSDKLEVIRQVAEAVGGEVYEQYSGRGMYGESCVGIDCEDDREAIEEAASRGLRGALRDSLGTGFIVYWPSVKWEPAHA